MITDDLSLFVSVTVVLTAIVVGAMVVFGVSTLARQPGVLSEGPDDLADAARIARVDRWTLGVVSAWAAAALLTTFVVGGQAAIVGLAYIGALVAIGYALITLTAAGRSLLDAAPQSWLIGIQTFRIVGGVFLFAGAYDALPAYFAIPAGWGDLITGVSALLVAMWWASGVSFARPAAWAWNIFGLLDLLVAVGIALSILAAPAAAIFGGTPAWMERAALGFQPFAPPIFLVGSPLTLIPTFLAPLAILLHLLSLRKLVTESARGDLMRGAELRSRGASAAAFESRVA